MIALGAEARRRTIKSEKLAGLCDDAGVTSPLEPGDRTSHDRLMELMQAAGQTLERPLSTPVSNLTPGQEVVLGLAMWDFGLYFGIFTLLQAGLPHEAQLLLRTLLVDTTRLEYLRRHQSDLESLAQGFLREALLEERSLEVARRHAFPGAALPPQRPPGTNDLMSKVRLPSRKLPTFKDMATNIGHPEFYYMHKLFSMTVHTSRIAMGSKFANRDAESMWMGRIHDVQEEVRVGNTATSAAVVLVAAAGELLGSVDASRVVGSIDLTGWEALVREVAILGRSANEPQQLP